METTKTTAWGWKINPFTKTISRITHNPQDYKELYSLLSDPNGYEVGCMAVAAYLGNQDCILIDDEGKLYGDLEKQKFFLLCLPDGAVFLIAGCAVVFGTDDEGETVDARSQLMDVAALVTFFPEDLQDKARLAAIEEIEAGPTIIAFDDKGNQIRL